MKHYLNLLGKKSKKAFLDKINTKIKNKVLNNKIIKSCATAFICLFETIYKKAINV